MYRLVVQNHGEILKKNYTKPCIWLKAYVQNYSYIVDSTIDDTTECVERKYEYRSTAARTQ